MFFIHNRCVYGESLAPRLQDLGNGRVISKRAVDLRFSQDVVVACAGVSVAEDGQLVLSQCHQLVLVFRADLAELLHGLVDGLHHEGEDGVLGVVHLALGDALECQFEDISLDFGLVVLVGDVDALQGLLHNVGDDFVSVDGLEGFRLFEDVLCAGVEVVLERELFGDEELSGRVVTLRRVLLRMER